jgi:hypothetical protein
VTVQGQKEFTSVGESLKRHWSSHNVDNNCGVSEPELDSFEATHRVVLPQDVRDYFMCVNGMPPDVVDDGMIRFWMLEEVKPLPQGAPKYSDSRYIQNPETLFLFADYSIWAHAYAIRLGKVPSQFNEVVIIGYKSPVLISNSFSEFVDRYLTDKDMLH